MLEIKVDGEMGERMSRKIKRHSHIYKRKKSKFRRVISTTLTILVMAALVVIGYSVGKPLFEFFNKNIDTSSLVSSWSPNSVLSEIASQNQSKANESASGDSISQTPVIEKKSLLAKELPVNALSSLENLSANLTDAKSKGYESVIIQLKDDMGYVLYKSSLSQIENTNVITGQLTLSQIITEVKKSNLEAYARINTLKDHIAPRTIEGTGYKFEDGITGWLDNYPDRGGKPWMAPYYSPSRAYICDLTAEIARSGFSKVIYSNVVFPNFYDYDLIYIGAKVQAADKYTSLAAVVTEGQITAKGNNSDVLLEITIPALLADKAEILNAKTELENVAITVTYTDIQLGGKLGSITVDTNPVKAVKQVYSEVLKKVKNVEIYACLDSNLINATAIDGAIKALKEIGIENYIIR